MHCSNCGKEIDDKAEICMGCGVRISPPIKEDIGFAKKLGKAGVPGFRSGKKWKMVIAIFGYFWILMILLAAISGPSDNQGQPKKTDVYTIPITTSPVPIANVQTTAEYPSKYISIKYSAKKLDTLGSFSKSKEGHIYLVASVTIENHGYKEFSTNPNYFYVVADNIKYDYSWDSSSLKDNLDSIDILDGGSVKGSIAFEVPSNVENYKLQYESWSNYAIIYQPE